jgi:hypothetical protein
MLLLAMRPASRLAHRSDQTVVEQQALVERHVQAAGANSH